MILNSILNAILVWPCLTWAASIPKDSTISENSSDRDKAKLTSADGVTEYYTAFLNISYFDKNRGVYHTEKTETGRYSTNIPKDFFGTVVPLVSNFSVVSNANKSDLPDINYEITGCSGPFVKHWPKDGPWIALIKRGDCTFSQKIKNAESLNASGVLVYDHDSGNGGLQSMKVIHSSIPSVFTYNWKGKEIDRLVKEHDKVMLAIRKGSHCTNVRHINQNNTVTPSQVLYCTPEDAWEQFQTLLSKHNPFWNLTSYHDTYGVSERRSSVLFVSVSFIVLMVISITWLVLYYVQRFRYIHAKDRMERRLCVQAKRALAIIPIITISKDEDEDEDHCPVCLDVYKIGEAMRILPCSHRFHKACIDQWLLDKRTCPMCKMDILKHYGLIGDSDMMNFEERDESLLNLT